MNDPLSDYTNCPNCNERYCIHHLHSCQSGGMRDVQDELRSEVARLRERAALADEERDHFASDRDAWKARAEEWKRVGEYAAISALKDKCADAELAAGAMRRALEICIERCCECQKSGIWGEYRTDKEVPDGFGGESFPSYWFSLGVPCANCGPARTALAPDISIRTALQLAAAERLATAWKSYSERNNGPCPHDEPGPCRDCMTEIDNCECAVDAALAEYIATRPDGNRIVLK